MNTVENERQREKRQQKKVECTVFCVMIVCHEMKGCTNDLQHFKQKTENALETIQTQPERNSFILRNIMLI